MASRALAEASSIAIFLVYAKERTLLGREVYLPQMWAEDCARPGKPGYLPA